MTTAPKIGVIQFPGSNTERETVMACHRVGLEPIEFLWNQPHKKLTELDGYIIVGGVGLAVLAELATNEGGEEI